ncbi:hypothetical protein GGQ64_004796 [Rhizobium azooxidifex]|uniref:Uncharacterized protein n=1 Tax=Mycoplana azooxidifex TaxID=1636188 RepID=A0A7W6DBD0_9HYPH|nr:hypothetical protein [Mycoplana azooxidifex]
MSRSKSLCRNSRDEHIVMLARVRQRMFFTKEVTVSAQNIGSW